MKVYLAGPISGLTYGNAQDWRRTVREALGPDAECFSPLRSKGFLVSEGVLEQGYACHPLSTDRGIMTRDHWDCQTCDLLSVNLLDAPRVSIGTVLEIGWAYAYQKPIVCVMEASGDLHEHPMIREAIGYRLQTLEEAIHVARAILRP